MRIIRKMRMNTITMRKMRELRVYNIKMFLIVPIDKVVRIEPFELGKNLD